MKTRTAMILFVFLAAFLTAAGLLFSVQQAGSAIAQAQTHSAPTLTRVVPNSLPNDLDLTVTISGAGFTAEISGSLVITAPAVTVGNTSLEAVEWITSTMLRATIPWGFDPGVYTVTVTNPDGASASLTQALTVTQGFNVWSSEGPYGGSVTSLAVHPVQASLMYAAMQASYSYTGIGLFRSLDGGEHWALLAANTGNEFHAVGLSTPDPSLVYVDSENGLLRSEDSGLTWTQIQPPSMTFGQTRPYPHPTDPDVVFAAIDCTDNCGSLFYSDDRGDHWTERTNGLTDPQLTALAFDPVDPHTMYAGSGQGKVFRSVDGGLNWVEIGQPEDCITSLAVNPFIDREVWATGADNGGHWGFLSKFTGSGWKRVLPDADHPGMVTSILFHPEISGTLWAGSHGLVKSTDGGATWDAVAGAEYGANVIQLGAGSPDEMYLATSNDGVIKTSDGGLSWEAANQGLAGVYPQGLAIHPQEPATIYAAAHDSGLYKSNNGGSTWRKLPCASTFPGQPVIDPNNPQRVYITNLGFTEDDGLTWEQFTFPLPAQYAECCRATGTALAPAGEPGRLAMGVGFEEVDSLSSRYGWGGFYLSTDSGHTWEYIDVGQVISPVFSIAADPNSPLTLYAGTGQFNYGTGIWKSSDGGASWNPSGLAGEAVQSVAVHPKDSNIVYASVQNAVYKSNNAGQTWQEVASVDIGQERLQVIAADNLILYRYGWHGVSISFDEGLHWAPASGWLGEAKVGSMAVHIEGDRLTLYVGTAGGINSTASLSTTASAATAGTPVRAGVYRRTSVPSVAKIYLPLISRR